MFENWVTNIRNTSSSLKNKITSDNLSSRTSGTLGSIKSAFKNKATTISTYFNDSKSSLFTNNRASSEAAVECNNDSYDYDEIDQDVIDRFISIVSLDSNNYPRRNDREEIRRRLATGCDSDEFYGSGDKPGKKPSLQARLQSGMNLQICFMNETSSDTESPSSESAPPSRSGTPSATPSPPKSKAQPEPPKSLNLTSKVRESKASFTSGGANEDFFTRQARLQAEARLALSQAKDRARLQMEADRLSGKTSPITEMLRASLKKVSNHKARTESPNRLEIQIDRIKEERPTCSVVECSPQSLEKT